MQMFKSESANRNDAPLFWKGNKIKKQLGISEKYMVKSAATVENNVDIMARLLADSIINELNDLQNGKEFRDLLHSSDQELQEEARLLFDEVNNIKDRLQSLLL